MPAIANCVTTDADTYRWKSDSAYRIQTQMRAIDDAKFVSATEWRIVAAGSGRTLRSGRMA